MTSDSLYPSDNRLVGKNLEAIRGNRMLFQNLDFEIGAGAVKKIEGPNGAGKTTLLRILTGLGFASDGDVFWNGQNIRQNRDALHASLHYLGHLPAVKLQLTPVENLRFFQSVNGAGVNEGLIEQALDRFKLTDHKDVPCYSLSAGQKNRVSLCRMLVVHKPLWVLDEPFTALDDATIDVVENLIHGHIERNGLVVMTTHQSIRSEALVYETLALSWAASR